jgi:hypothetical protein
MQLRRIFMKSDNLHQLWRLFLHITALCLFAVAITGCSLNFGGTEGDAVAAISGAPIVEIAAPLPNSTYLQNVAVNILTSISNAGEDIQRVEISVNDTSIADLPSPNPSGAARFSVTQTWTPDGPGEYTITAIAYRADGSGSQPASVQINVIEGVPTSQVTEEVAEPTATRQVPTATATLAPTDEETEEASSETADEERSTDEADSSTDEGSSDTGSTNEAPAADSDDVVIQIVEGGINVRRGPSTNFVPPLGVITGDVTALAANTSLTWFKINYQGGEAWITGDESLVTVISGDPESLPRESGPPIPTLAPSTAPPAATATTGGGLSTAGPTSAVTGQPTGTGTGADLVVSNFVLEPKDPFCNQPAQMRANLSNIGNAPTATGGFVILAVENTDGSNRQTLGAAEIPTLTAGQQNFLVALDFRDTFTSNRADGIKRAIVIIDANNQIPEGNDNNNTSSVEFALGVPCQ